MVELNGLIDLGTIGSSPGVGPLARTGPSTVLLNLRTCHPVRMGTG